MKSILFLSCTLLGFVACGGDKGDIADRATKSAEKACKCSDFDCTKEGVAELNRMAISDADAVKALNEERMAVYKGAQKKGGDCQDKLRNK